MTSYYEARDRAEADPLVDAAETGRYAPDPDGFDDDPWADARLLTLTEEADREAETLTAETWAATARTWSLR